MARIEVTCGRCRTPVWRPLEAPDQQARCGSCGGAVAIHAFPALWEDRTASATAERVLLEGESCCFYHAEKRATVVCEGCGRFLCGLCDIEWEGQHLCPACVEAGPPEKQDATFQSTRTYTDSILLTAAVLSTILFQMALFIAPVVLTLAFLNRKKQMSVRPRSRWRLVVASLLSLVQIAFWLLFFVGLATAAMWEGGA